MRRDVWEKFRFNEDLTGCEDMELAKRLVRSGEKIGYIATAPVYHIHDEDWRQVKRRYEREALALQKILPELHLSLFDTVNFIFIGILKDFRAAYRKNCLWGVVLEVIRFRFAQYLGGYHGNHITRKISNKMKEKYFYPRVTDMEIKNE